MSDGGYGVKINIENAVQYFIFRVAMVQDFQSKSRQWFKWTAIFLLLKPNLPIS